MASELELAVADLKGAATAHREQIDNISARLIMISDRLTDVDDSLKTRIEALEARLEVRETSDDPLGPDPYLLREEISELYEWAQATTSVPMAVIDTMLGLWPWLLEDDLGADDPYSDDRAARRRVRE